MPLYTPTPAEAELTRVLSALLTQFGTQLSGWLRAWARVTPMLTLVPAFGGAALPAATRAGLGFALALAIAPALGPVAASHHPLALELLFESLRGLPVAVGAAVLLHVALMAGATVDELRNARATASIPVFESDATPFGALFGLLTAIAFLEFGGTTRLLAALVARPPARGALAAALVTLENSVSLALALAAPVIGASIVVSVVEALLARSASPAHIAGLLAPLRNVVLLAVAALALDRMSSLLALLSMR